jgi:hypothetical protein
MGHDSEITTDDGRRDFDFVFGDWKIANRKRVRPLAEGDTEWIEFDAVGEARPILGGIGNIDTYRAPDFPGRPGFEGFTLRLFEPDTKLWRIWWASTISGGRLEPPVVGRFQDGSGRFECDDVIDGVPLKVRYDWTILSADAIRWEQSFSFDEGATWDSNWIMDSTRIGAAAARPLATLSG